MRVGFGYDSHRFGPGDHIVLGGVNIPYDKGIVSHSDGDVLIHAVIDAMLGAAGLGNIGQHFPDTDPAYKDADSMRLLEQTIALLDKNSYRAEWIDATIIAETPKLQPYVSDMIANLIGVGIAGASVKAKTNEGMGPVGRGEGIVAYAVVMLERIG